MQAEIVAHLQRQHDEAMKDLRAELEAEIALRCAEVGRELALRAAELDLAVLSAKSDLCKRMERTIAEMQEGPRRRRRPRRRDRADQSLELSRV